MYAARAENAPVSNRKKTGAFILLLNGNNLCYSLSMSTG
jgi:hypothetical protein